MISMIEMSRKLITTTPTTTPTIPPTIACTSVSSDTDPELSAHKIYIILCILIYNSSYKSHTYHISIYPSEIVSPGI